MLRSPLRPLLRKPMQGPVGLAVSSLINQLLRFSADFTNGSPTPAVRTTRSGLATQIGPDGTLQWGPHNLLGESENFSDALWTKDASSVPTIGYPAPNGTATARLLLPDATNVGTHRIRQQVSAAASCTYIESFYLKASGYNWTKLRMGAFFVNINLLTGAIGYASGATGGAQNLGDGWYRCWILTTQSLSNQFVYAYASATDDNGPDTAAFSGDGNSGVYLWHPQVENVTGTNRTTPGAYVDSTVKNRLGYSNDFVNAAWIPLGSAKVYPNTCTGPNGQPATTIVAGGTGSEIYQRFLFAGTYTTGMLIRRRSGTGVVSLRDSANTAWLPQPITADWAIYQNGGGVAATYAYCDLLVATAGDSIDICDAQLNPGTTLWPYSYNPGAAPAVGPIYGQRTDYDPVTLACKGALIEPTQVTQLLANPDDLSASPWTTNNGSCPAVNDGTKYRGRPMWKVTKSGTTPSENRQQSVGTQSGYQSSRIAFMALPGSTSVEFGLWAGAAAWGDNSASTCVIESGPGTLTQVAGGMWIVLGLSINVPTVLLYARDVLTANVATMIFYPAGSASTTTGAGTYIQIDNIVAGRDGGGSFIPNPATSGTVVRVADDARVNYDDLAKALPWLMDTNIIPAAKVESFDAWTKTGSGTASLPVVTANDSTYAAPDGTFTADKVVFNVGAGTTAANESSIDSSSIVTVTGAAYTGSFRVMGSAGTQLMLRHVGGSAYGLITCSGLGIWDEVPGRTEIAGTTSSSMSIGIRQGLVGTINATATVWLWGAKLNPGPVAQQYYPQASKQGTILFEGDLTYGAASGGMSLFALENGSSNRVELYKGSVSNTLSGLFNANSGSPGNISSGTVFKSLIGFSPSSAGIVLNGGAETAITATSFAAAPNVLKLGNDAVNSVASSMHIRRLRIFSQNLPASTKQALTR